jgi:hypothetical protein
MVALGFLMAADYLRTPKVHERLIRSIVQKRFPVCELANRFLPAGAQDEVEVLTEITLKIFQIERKRSADAHLRRLIPLTHSLVSLLRDCGSEATELERALNLAKVSKPEDGLLQIENTEADWTPNTRKESIEDIRREIDHARFSTSEIIQHLETLMLRVFQIEQLPNDPVRNSELVRNTEELVAKLTQQSESRRADRYISAAVQQTREGLRAVFSEINSSDGLSALQRLVYEYVQLQHFLERKRATDSIGLVHISASVEDTYRTGLVLLYDALELMRAVQPPEKRRLESEIHDLKEKIETLGTDASQQARVKLMEATLSSHLERLELMQNQCSRIEELLHVSGRCEASLHRTRMELAALKADDSESQVRAATESLRRTIDQAKEVREELKKLGF